MVFSDSDVYKWLEAIAWELGREPSAELERLGARDDGARRRRAGAGRLPQQLVPGRRPRVAVDRPGEGHELYCAGHLFQAGVASARATGDTTLLTVARRFADLIDEVFGKDTDTRTDGHPEVEVALVELYRQTGERRYLELADTLTSRRGYGMFAGGRFDLDYYQDAEPVRDARSIVGHAVRALYLAAGVTDIYAETGDKALLASMLRQWDDLTATKTYLTGGIGSRHHGEAIGDPYELPPDRAYCETCAAIASIMWNWRMLLVTGESRFADLLERTLYNGFLSGLSLDGESFFYIESAAVAERRATPPLEPRRVLPAQRDAAARVAAPLPRHRPATRRPAASVRDVDDPRRRAGRGPGRAGGRDELPVVGLGRRSRSSRAATRSGRSRSGSRRGRGPRSVDGEPVAPGVRGADAALAGRRPRRPRARRLAEAHRAEPADRRRARVRRARTRPDRLLPRGARSARRRRSGRRRPRPGGRPRRQRAGRAAGRPARACALQGVVRDVDGWRQTEYRDLRELPAASASPTQLLAVPYFAWANRDGGGMRVWIPAAE